MRLLLDHTDRDAIRDIAERDLESLVLEHGGRKRGRMLSCPFHDDQSPSASVRAGRFHCFACNLPLDPFAFVMKARAVDFRTALRILSERYCIPLNNRKLTPAERRAYQRERSAADREARDLVAWRDGMLAMIRSSRDAHMRATLRAQRFIAVHSMEHPISDRVADIANTCAERWQRLEEMIDVIQRAPWFRLVDFYRRIRKAETVAA